MTKIVTADTRDLTVSKSRPRLLLIAALALLVTVTGNAHAGSLPLQWNAPTTNADGSALADLANYRLYLGTTAPACPSPSFHVVSSPTSTPASGEIVASRIAGLSAGTTYFARVTAVDTSGNESACSASTSGSAQADFAVTPTTATSFGSITVGSTVNRTFTVQNVGPVNLSGSVSVGAPFTIVSGGAFSLAPGASHTATVRFAPTTTGSYAGNVNVTAGGDTVSRAVSGTATAATVTLSVSKNGTGSGSVTSSPGGIICGADCTESVAPGTQLALTAMPAAGSTFAGWSGACTGTGPCTVTMSGATTVNATFNTVQVGISVTKNGTGTGTVTSTPAGIVCGTDCSESVTPGSQLTLTATPAAGSTFAGWSGACSGTGSCAVTVNTATSVTATFNLTPVTLSVTKSGTGSGSVTSSPGGITCGADCTESVAPGTQLALTAMPAAGSTFVGWSGACSGTAACTVTMSVATTVTANFNLLPSPVQLSVTKTGTGGGRVSSTPAGIDCGSTCAGSMAPGTVVTLTAVASDGSVFTGWGGACSGTVTTCTWTLSASTAVSAAFDAVRLDRPLRRAPVPVARSLSPSRTTAGGSGLTLTVKGKGFVAGSVVRWNGSPRTTTYVTSSQLRAAITAADLATPASVPVDVVSPAPGGGTSEPLSFTITAAPTSTTSLSTSTLSTSTLSTSLSTSTVSVPDPGREIVMDNAEPGVQDSVGGRTFTGSWCRARTRTSFGSSALFACGRDLDTYRWTPRIPVSGLYDVYIWIPASRWLSTSVPFVVAHGTGTTVLTLNQRTGTGRWVLHGQYFFQAGTAGYVETSSGRAWVEGGTAADAVRFVRR